MNTINNKKIVLNDLLLDFFDKSQIQELSQNFIDKITEKKFTSNKLSGKVKEQINIELNESNFRLGIDLLITFGESKLLQNKFFDFLLALGQLSITSGEFALGIDIHEKILAQTKNQVDFYNIIANAHFALADLSAPLSYAR